MNWTGVLYALKSEADHLERVRDALQAVCADTPQITWGDTAQEQADHQMHVARDAADAALEELREAVRLAREQEQRENPTVKQLLRDSTQLAAETHALYLKSLRGH